MDSVWAPTKLKYGNANPQCDGVGGGPLRGDWVMRADTSPVGSVPLKKRLQRAPSSPASTA